MHMIKEIDDNVAIEIVKHVCLWCAINGVINVLSDHLKKKILAVKQKAFLP